MHLQVREARRKDSEPIAHLLDELGYPTTPGEVSSRIDSMQHSAYDRVFVATYDSRCAGLAALHVMPYFPTGGLICRLSALVVATEHRGCGIGSLLLAETERFAEERNCDGVEITTASHRTEAHAFYAGRGYKQMSLRFFKPIPLSDTA